MNILNSFFSQKFKTELKKFRKFNALNHKIYICNVNQDFKKDVQIESFLNEMIEIFPDNVALMTTKNTLLTLKKFNPKLLIGVWYRHIWVPYKDDISAGDVKFFIEIHKKKFWGKVNCIESDNSINKKRFDKNNRSTSPK